MKLITIQWKGVLDILNAKGVYKAQYGYGFKDYAEQYKQLAKLCNFSSCPIFCSPLNDDTSLYGIVKDDIRIKMTLDVSKSRIREMDYYDWSTYLSYSSGLEGYDYEFGFTPEEALVNIDKYLLLGESRIPQYCIQEIYLEDIKQID